jgi:predicted metallopeptidase
MTARRTFDFTRAMHALMCDIAAVCEELRHVDMTRVAVIFSQARHGRTDGVHAATHPLRFEGGATETVIRGHRYVMPRVRVDGREMLYVVSFTLPRFLDAGGLEQKVATVVHEMYHISPEFNGDLRRFGGGKPYHTGSQRRYDRAMAAIARRYMARTQQPELHEFLRSDFKALAAAWGALVGMQMRNLNPRRVD